MLQLRAFGGGSRRHRNCSSCEQRDTQLIIGREFCTIRQPGWPAGRPLRPATLRSSCIPVSTAPHCSPCRHIRQRPRRLFSSVTVFLLFFRFVMQLCLRCQSEPDTATRVAEHKCGRACWGTVIGLVVALGRRARSAADLAGAGARRVRAVSSVNRGAATTTAISAISAASGTAGAVQLRRARQVWPANLQDAGCPANAVNGQRLQQRLCPDSPRPRVSKIRSLSLRITPALPMMKGCTHTAPHLPAVRSMLARSAGRAPPYHAPAGHKCT